MDYHVFILSRVREAHDRGLTTEDAVAHGIKTTAGVVTSAALVMVGVFSIFVTLPILDVKQLDGRVNGELRAQRHWPPTLRAAVSTRTSRPPSWRRRPAGRSPGGVFVLAEIVVAG
jgi:hypothetical protein